MHAAAAHHERWAPHMFGQQVWLNGNGEDAFCRTGKCCARLKMMRQVGHKRIIRSRKALVITLTEESAMAAAAMAGESIQPKVG